MSKYQDQAEEATEIVLRFRVSNRDQRQIERLAFFGEIHPNSMSRVTATRPATAEEGKLWDLLIGTEASLRAVMEEKRELQLDISSLKKEVAQLLRKQADAVNAYEVLNAYEAKNSLGEPRE